MGRYYIQPIDPAELASRFSTEDVLNPIHGCEDDWKTPRLNKIRDVLNRLPDRETDLIKLYFFRDKKQTDIAEIFGITQAAVSYRIKRALSRIRFLVDMPNLDKFDVYEILIDIMPEKLDAEIFREMYESTCQSEVAERLDITQGRVRHRFIKNLAHLGNEVVNVFESWIKTLDPETFEYQEVRQRLDYLLDNAFTMDIEDFEDDLIDLIEYIESLPDEMTDQKVLRLASVYRVFVHIRYNFNILREVKLPKWSDRAKNSIA